MVDKKDLGQPLEFDPEFRGPVKSRSCTDILCLLLFVGFLVGWGVVGYFAATNGDPSRLLYPTDSRGRVCGKDPDLVDKPYLLFFDLTRCASPKVIATGCPTPQVCVAECPQKNWGFTGINVDVNDLICKDGTDKSKDVVQLVKDGDCAYYYVESKPFGRRCIPQKLTQVADYIKDSSEAMKHLSKSQRLEIVSKALRYLSRLVQFVEVLKKKISHCKNRTTALNNNSLNCFATNT